MKESLEHIKRAEEWDGWYTDMGFIGQTWKKIAINTPEDVRLAKDTDRLKTCKRKNYMKSLNLGHSEVGQLKQLEKYILLPAPFNNLLPCWSVIGRSQNILERISKSPSLTYRIQVKSHLEPRRNLASNSRGYPHPHNPLFSLQW